MKFLLPFSQLNLVFLSLEKKDKVVEKYKLVFIETMENFEYKKNNDKYWNGVKLYYQIMKKTLFIMKNLYSRYFFFFL